MEDIEMNNINRNERAESGGSQKEERRFLNFFNKRSRIQHLDNKDCIVYYFDYKKLANTVGETDRYLEIKDTEIINWQVLRAFKRKNKWIVMRHPMVLNFINERLLDCALFYTLHILAYVLFLLLLSSHIFSRSMFKNCAISTFILIFIFFMVLKGTVKARLPENRVSFGFVVACVFHSLTYAATALYVWPNVLSFDDYHQEVKEIILWFLPTVAIISAYLNFLYILRKSPYGIYVFMMARILRSFGHIAIVWIPTLIAFSFAFHLTMRDSRIEPWESIDKNANATNLLVILQAITKTSSMMIGEIGANEVLGTRQWIPCILVLIFEIIAVILLMNLMVSVAVGDVIDLRNAAQDMLLKIKVNFVIEALQLSRYYLEKSFCGIPSHYERKTHNILVVHSEGGYHTLLQDLTLSQEAPSNEKGIPLVEVPPISPSPSNKKGISLAENNDGLFRRYCKWIIGLDWTGYLDL